MKCYIELGSTPINEDCVQVQSDKDYLVNMITECSNYVELLEETFPIPDELIGLTYFGRKSFDHDFGRYYEAVIYYDDEIEESVQFAYDVESNLPTNWKEEENDC